MNRRLFIQNSSITAIGVPIIPLGIDRSFLPNPLLAGIGRVVGSLLLKIVEETAWRYLSKKLEPHVDSILGLISSADGVKMDIPQDIKHEIYSTTADSVDLHVILDQYGEHQLSVYLILNDIGEPTIKRLLNHSYVRFFDSKRYMTSVNFPDMVAIDRLAEHFLENFPVSIDPGIALTKALLPRSMTDRSFFPPTGIDCDISSSVIRTDHGYVHVIYEIINEFEMRFGISYRAHSKRSRFPSTNLEFIHDFKN